MAYPHIIHGDYPGIIAVAGALISTAQRRVLCAGTVHAREGTVRGACGSIEVAKINDMES